MVSPSKPRHSRVANHQYSHKCKLIKGPKPLTQFKFYLDIDKHHIESKIEKLIKELGGSIEFFLTKTVTHFVTNKLIGRDGNLLNLSPSLIYSAQNNIQKTPSPAPQQTIRTTTTTTATTTPTSASYNNNSHLSNDVNNSDDKSPIAATATAATSRKSKTRADVMVQKARQPTINTITSIESHFNKNNIESGNLVSNLNQTPIQLAQNWGTPIWSIEYTLKFLEKVSISFKFDNDSPSTTAASATAGTIASSGTPTTKSNHQHHHHHHHKSAGAKCLNGDFIKIESTQKHYRPYYQEFTHWPTINFNCSVCPFQVQSDKVLNRKTKLRQLIAKAARGPLTKKSTATGGGDGGGAGDQSNIQNTVSISNLSINNIQNQIIDNKMTRKTRNKQVRDTMDACNIKANDDVDMNPNTVEKCGYCEKCRIEYDVLSLHLQSKEHMNFVKNNDNYITLDNLINSGSNVETFLRRNTNQLMLNSMSDDTNGMRSPKRDRDTVADVTQLKINNIKSSTITTTTTNTNTTSTIEMNNDIATAPYEGAKLPKYSPPITRRSQTKNLSNHIDDDITTPKIDLNSKLKQTTENNRTIDFDLKEDEENVFMKADNSLRVKGLKANKVSTPINGKKKCEDLLTDDSPPLPKRLIRAFPRYKVAIDESSNVNKTSEKSTAKLSKNLSNNTNKNVECTNEATKTSTTTSSATSTTSGLDKNNDTDLAGLIVKFKRVRESELSKLTYEADNFMFPKQRDDLPTDEDRQSTSERDEHQELSSDILSSEFNSSQRESLPNSLNTTFNVNNTSTSSDQFTSSGRRKKRRSQFDNTPFKSPAEQKRRFRKTPIQSRLVSNKGTLSLATSTVNETQTLDSRKTKRSAKLSTKAKAAATKSRTISTCSSTAAAAATTTVAAEATTTNTSNSDSLLDGIGENAYNGGKLLATEFFQNLKFSFERVPSNEPWYLTFQRQDEHQERMFEYWGNTDYRKLPFELGPLPPLQPDCCILSKIAAIKATKKMKRVPRGSKQLNKCSAQSASSDSGVANIKKEYGDELTDTVGSTTDDAIRSNSKTDGIVKNNSKISTITAAATTTSIKSNEDRKSQTSTLSQLLLADSSLNSISLPSAIPTKKKGMLLDASGQPRKSPREHASTLAILSSLVQQRRKRIKEMNGGISPEKMPIYKAAVASAMAAKNLAAENSENDEADETNDEINERFQMNVNNQSTSEMKTRRRSNQTPIFELNKSSIATEAIDTNPRCSHSSMEQSDRFFRLRKGKRRQTESVSSNNESIKADETNDTKSSKQQKSTQQLNEFDQLKIPIDDYVDPNKLVRELDDMLNYCYNSESELNHIPVDCEDDCAELISRSPSKDFVEIVESITDGPLTYRSLQRGKKRHINKTGWPSIPKRRLTKREKMNDCIESNVEDTTTGANTDDETVPLNMDGDNFDVTFEETLPMNINQRQRIRTPFCDDNAVQFTVFTSSSEKAENSDIFTVSSDSYLDTDAMNDTNMTKSGLSADSNATEDDGSMSDDTIGNNRSSHDESPLEEQQQQKSFNTGTSPSTTIVTTSILERTLTNNMSTRSTYLRSPTTSIDFKLQVCPLVRVQKISEKDLPTNQWLSNEQRIPANQSNQDDEEIEISRSIDDDDNTTKSLVQTTSPIKTKTSPRKLRKPRGRWYRER